MSSSDPSVGLYNLVVQFPKPTIRISEVVLRNVRETISREEVAFLVAYNQLLTRTVENNTHDFLLLSLPCRQLLIDRIPICYAPN